MNYIAVIGAALLNMALGMVWYHPKAFGTLWMKAVGLKEIDKKGMGAKYAANAAASLVFAIVLALVINMTGTTSAAEGALLGATVWLGFMATSNLPAVTFEGRPLRAYLIFAGYQLVVYAVSGAALAALA